MFYLTFLGNNKLLASSWIEMTAFHGIITVKYKYKYKCISTFYVLV